MRRVVVMRADWVGVAPVLLAARRWSAAAVVAELGEDEVEVGEGDGAVEVW